MKNTVTLSLHGLSERQAKIIAEHCYGKLDWTDFEQKAIVAQSEGTGSEQLVEIIPE